MIEGKRAYPFGYPPTAYCHLLVMSGWSTQDLRVRANVRANETEPVIYLPGFNLATSISPSRIQLDNYPPPRA